MYKVISQCPVCGGQLKVIENDFHLNKFDYLSEQELFFIETFISCRGNIKEVEKELKISYPTVRSRLDEVIEKLGCKPAPVSGNKKKEILDALERGEITPEEALEQMK